MKKTRIQGSRRQPLGRADVLGSGRRLTKKAGVADSSRRRMGRVDVPDSSHPPEGHKVAPIASEVLKLRPSPADESSIHMVMVASGKLDSAARSCIFPSPEWTPGSPKEDR